MDRGGSRCPSLPSSTSSPAGSSWTGSSRRRSPTGAFSTACRSCRSAIRSSVGRRWRSMATRSTADGRDLIAIAPADMRPVVARRLPGDPFEQVLVRSEKDRRRGRTSSWSWRRRSRMGAHRTRPPAGRHRRHPRRAATAIKGDDLSPPTGTLSADRRGRRRGSAGRPRSPRSTPSSRPARSTSSGRCARRSFTPAGPKLTRCCSSGAATMASGAMPCPAPPASELRDAGVRLSVIDVGTGATPPQLADLAAGSGGEVVVARSFPESLPYVADALHPRPRSLGRSEGGRVASVADRRGRAGLDRARHRRDPAGRGGGERHPGGFDVRARRRSGVAVDARADGVAQPRGRGRHRAGAHAGHFPAGAGDRAGLSALRSPGPRAGSDRTRRGRAPPWRRREDGEADLGGARRALWLAGTDGQPRPTARAERLARRNRSLRDKNAMLILGLCSPVNRLAKLFTASGSSVSSAQAQAAAAPAKGRSGSAPWGPSVKAAALATAATPAGAAARERRT